METVITTTDKGLRTGYTTGTCATCASDAAVRMLVGGAVPKTGAALLPDGERISLPIAFAHRHVAYAAAGVKKFSGDDPDDTDRALVVSTISWQEGAGIRFVAGPGVGIVTKPGLSVPVGEPAITPVPRRMIVQAIRSVTERGVAVAISIPGGESVAQKTFNPKLGIHGGLSVLGTSGRVVPYSCPAVRESLCLLIRIAAASGVRFPVIAPGNIGAGAARRHFNVHEAALLHASNEWDAVLGEASAHGFARVLIVGHPGKLAKLIDGHFQTHSKRSPSALPIVHRFLGEASVAISDSPTVEGCLSGLSFHARCEVSNNLAEALRRAVETRFSRLKVSAALIDMGGTLIGEAGDLSPWRGKT